MRSQRFASLVQVWSTAVALVLLIVQAGHGESLEVEVDRLLDEAARSEERIVDTVSGQLAQMGPSIYPILQRKWDALDKERWGKEDEEVGATILSALEQIDQEGKEDMVIRIMAEALRNPLVSSIPIGYFNGLDPEKFSLVIIEGLKEVWQRDYALGAAYALVKTGDQSLIPLLEEGFDVYERRLREVSPHPHPDRPFTYRAIFNLRAALAQLGAQRHFDDLVAQLSSDEPHARQQAIYALERTGNESVAQDTSLLKQ